jgi:ribosome recycling factor
VLDETLRDAQRRMHTAVEVVERELRTLRTGRANISILDEVVVDYYGAPTPINQLGSMSAPEPQLLLVQPYDKGAIAAIEKAIMQSNLGLNPNNDGAVIRIPIPELTEERRHDMAKHVNQYAEDGKTAVRNVRRDANDSAKKLEQNKEISEDDERRAHDTIQELTNKFCEDIDRIAEAKRQELLTI